MSRKLRLLSYAVNGRGMGHLSRQLAILRWAQRICEVMGVGLERWVLTSSEADTLARREGVAAIKIPSKSMLKDGGLEPSAALSVLRSWVLSAVGSLRPDVLVVDTFPGGSFGEIGPVLEMVRWRALVARPVRPEVQRDPAWYGPLPLYHRVIVPEEPFGEAPGAGQAGAGGAGLGARLLHDPANRTGPILLREREELLPRARARAALGVPEGARAVWLSLGGGGDPGVESGLRALLPVLALRGLHAVVGAGPLYTGEELRGPGVTWMDRYVPVELFQGLDLAVSAGGYNSFHELMYAGVPTIFLAQPKLADDQRARAARAAAAGAGRVAGSLAEAGRWLDDPGDPAAARALVAENHARHAAARILSLALPADEVQQALRLFPPELLGVFAARGIGSGAGLEFVRAISGEARSGEARGGAQVAQVARLLAAAPGLPVEIRAELIGGLRKRFPAAAPGEFTGAALELLATWEPYDDWMGALSLLRAVPVQRMYRIQDFARDLQAFLAAQPDTREDLYEALRLLAAREGGGRMTVAEALRTPGVLV